MGSGTPEYLGNIIIAEYDCPEFETDISNRRIIEREASNHQLSLRGIHITKRIGGTETIRIEIENARNNLQSVAAFQHAVSLVFRFNSFQKRAVTQTSPHPATTDPIMVDWSATYD